MNKKSPNILVVDDEPDITSYFQSFFGRRGFIVNTAASGRDALKIISASKPDLVFLDLTLPEMTGKEILYELRKYDKETKVIVITGHTLDSEQEKEEFKALGITAYLNKPLTLEEVDRIVTSIFGNSFPSENFDKYAMVKHPDARAEELSPHKLRNLLGNIKGECQVYLINKKSGKYSNKSKEELEKISDDILRNVVDTVNKVIESMGEAKKDK